MSRTSNEIDWTSFLKKFAEAIRVEKWPGRVGASEEQLSAAEKRLRVKLPPSYRAFLMASDGWEQASHSVPVLRSVEDIRWFHKEHPDWVEAYSVAEQGTEPRPIPERDYFNYSEQDSVNFDVKHLPHTLCISDLGNSAVLLLNPMVVWPDGEWETWFFANWLPGASRYHSFADWMRREFAQLLDEPFEHTKNPGELPTVYLDGPTKSKRRLRPREEALVLDDVLRKITSNKSRERIKAVQQLLRLGGNEAVDTLLNVLKSDSDFHVRCEAAEVLGRLSAAKAIDVLIDTVEENSVVSSTAIHALGGFNDERSAQCLLKLIEQNRRNATVAVYPLAKRGDGRAVKHLLRALTSKDPADQHLGSIAGRFIAQFEEAGFLALEPLMTHPDSEIRRRAMIGMSDLTFLPKEKSLKAKALNHLQRCLETETDTELRRLLEVSIEVRTKKNRL